MLDGSAATGVRIEAVGDLYGLYIGDTQVNSHNCDDILGDGKLKFNPSAKVLYINGDVDLSSCKNSVIRNESIDGLEIYDNNTKKDAYTLTGSLDIQADTAIRNPLLAQFELTVNPVKGSTAVKVSKGAKLTLKSAVFTAEGAIAGSMDGEKLEVNYCTVNCKGDGKSSAVSDFSGGITLNECRIEAPAECDYSGAAVVTKDGEPVTGKLLIRRIGKYNVSINAKQITDENIGSLEDLFTKSSDAAAKRAKGEHFASFDTATQTLTLKDIDLEKDSVMFTGDSRLNIEGNVKFGTSLSFAGEGTKTITGSGTLTSTDPAAYVYAALLASLEIRETTVNAEINGGVKTSGSLLIFGSNINAAKIVDFGKEIKIEECKVVSPENAVIGNSVFLSDGSTAAENVVIQSAHVHAEKLKAVAKVGATCETDGNIAYYECTCGRKFKEKEAKTELTDAEIVIPATGHSIAEVAAKAPTCEADGNTAHFICKNCKKLFADKQGNTAISDPASVVIPALGHDHGYPVYTWSKDFAKVTAKCVCNHDASHIITETVETTCTEMELGTVYKADFADPHFVTQVLFLDNTAVTITVGDVNSDGTVDMLDAMLLTRYVNAREGIVIDLNAADLDRNGTVDNLDAMILARYVAAWENYDKYIIQTET